MFEPSPAASPATAGGSDATAITQETWEVNWLNELTRADPAKVCSGGQPRV